MGEVQYDVAQGGLPKARHRTRSADLGRRAWARRRTSSASEGGVAVNGN